MFAASFLAVLAFMNKTKYEMDFVNSSGNKKYFIQDNSWPFLIDFCLPKSGYHSFHTFQVISQWARREALPSPYRTECMFRWDDVNKAFIKECSFQDFFRFHLAQIQPSCQRNICLKQKKGPAISSALCSAALHLWHTPSLTSYREERVTCPVHAFRGCFTDSFIPLFQISGLILGKTFKEKLLSNLSSFAFQTILFCIARLFCLTNVCCDGVYHNINEFLTVYFWSHSRDVFMQECK